MPPSQWSMPRRPLTPHEKVVVFLIVLAVADGLAIWFARGVYRTLEWSVVSYALIFSQVGLAAIWCALGGGSAVQRIAGLVIVNVAATAILPLISNDLRWMLVVGMQMAAIYLPLVPIRVCWGIRWRLLGSESSGGDVAPFQFTLRQAMIGMTAMAIVFGIARLTVTPGPFLDKSELVFVALLACGFAITALAAACAAYGLGRIWQRCILFALVTGAAAFAQTWLFPAEGAIVGLLTASPAVLLAICLWIIRRIGFGLVRDARPGALASDFRERIS